MESRSSICIVHYDEIALKGANRIMFEKALMNSIQKKVTAHGLSKDFILKRAYGRIAILPTHRALFSPVQKETLHTILSTTFGIAHFSFAISSPNTITDIENAALEYVKHSDAKTFRVTAHRANKHLSFSSQDVAIKVGAAIQNACGFAVNLTRPDFTVFIDLLDTHAAIYLDKIPGLGGLPTATTGHALVLLSGGIDSPVASFLAQKRGLQVSYLHFHSHPYTSAASIQKVKELKAILDRFSGTSQLHLCAFSDLQKHIALSAPDEYRIILYRRLMMHIANKLATNIGAGVIITGEALGQVASQTLENMAVIDDASETLVLRPLVSMDKKDIIKWAKKIGTFKTSIIPHDDCCTVFMPKRPATRARQSDVEKIEERLTVDDLVAHAVESIDSQEHE
jgi:tRNA uracil 4-sulfurtransferase